MKDETTGVPERYPLPPMRIRDWIYGMASIGIVVALWWSVFSFLGWLFRLAARAIA